MRATKEEKQRHLTYFLNIIFKQEMLLSVGGAIPRAIHHDQICRMNTYLKAVQTEHWMIEDEENLVMFYDAWDAWGEEE